MASLSVQAKQCKISSPLDSRDARFEFWSFDFSQKPILSRKHDAAQIQFEQFLNQCLEWIVSNFLLHSILEMSDSSSEGLISVKNRLLCRKHDAPQIHFELIFWMNCVKFLLHTILDMPISGFERSNSFKRTIAEILLEKKDCTCSRTWKTNSMCILTHKWEITNSFFVRS